MDVTAAETKLIEMSRDKFFLTEKKESAFCKYVVYTWVSTLALDVTAEEGGMCNVSHTARF